MWITPRKSTVIGIGLFLGTTAIFAAAAVFVIKQPLWRPSAKMQSPAVDTARPTADTRKLAEEFIPRDWRHTENLDRVAAYIRDEFESAGAALQDQRYEMEGKTYRNVVARFGPESKEAVIVGAHYDAF